MLEKSSCYLLFLILSLYIFLFLPKVYSKDNNAHFNKEAVKKMILMR